jgi:hypothetical protein
MNSKKIKKSKAIEEEEQSNPDEVSKKIKKKSVKS